MSKMHKVELNIGLNIGQNGMRLGAATVIQAVVDMFLPSMILADVRRAASGEDTLVVVMATLIDPHDARIERLCRLLHQECIAGKLDGVGFLRGVDTSNYGGAFNADYWLNF